LKKSLSKKSTFYAISESLLCSINFYYSERGAPYPFPFTIIFLKIILFAVSVPVLSEKMKPIYPSSSFKAEV
jgi:hypothetical protein